MLNIEQNSNEVNQEYNIAIMFNEKGYLPDSSICSCGNKKFAMQKDKNFKTSGIIWRCNSYKCRTKRNIRTNSLFEKFSKLTLTTIYEVVKCFLYFNFNKKRLIIILLMRKNYYITEFNKTNI